jgi:hypothetical protein
MGTILDGAYASFNDTFPEAVEAAKEAEGGNWPDAVDGSPATGPKLPFSEDQEMDSDD